MRKEIQPEQFDKNAFQMIGKDWMLVTAEKDGKVNTMTASWGGAGVMWGKMSPLWLSVLSVIPKNLLMRLTPSPFPF